MLQREGLQQCIVSVHDENLTAQCFQFCAGDAHYTYRNAASFPTYGNLEVHNRKELLSWLDKIIEGTQKAHNFHLVSDDEDGLSASVAVTPGSPVTLPTFITTRRGLICSGKSPFPGSPSM